MIVLDDDLDLGDLDDLDEEEGGHGTKKGYNYVDFAGNLNLM